jgi:AcrR family transcriptional regulator
MSEERKRRRARGRPRGFDTGAALDRAVAVFWRRGYAGAGLAELTAAMNISPPSLYAAFGDKRGLFLAALDRYAATVGATPLVALRAAEHGAGLRAFLKAAVELAYDGESGRGCLAACVAADAAGDDEAIRDRLAAMLRGYEEALQGTAGDGAPAGRVLLAAMHAIAVRARAGAARADVEVLAEDLEAQLCQIT